MTPIPAAPTGAQWMRAAFFLPVAAGALAVGALTTVQPLAAIAVVVGAAVLLVVAANVHALPLFLVFTMFVSSLSLGPGLAIGRVAAPMALAVLVLYVLERGANNLRPNVLLAVVFVYGLWTLLSVYWADDSGLVYSTMFSYLIAVVYMLAFAILIRRPGQILAVFATLAVGSFLFGVAAFAAFYASSSSARSEGLVGDPNFFAVYQVLALPPTLVLAARETRPWRRLGYLAIVAVIILSVVSSLSRTGLIALSAVLLATMALPWRIFFRNPAQKLTYVLMVVVASGVAVAAGSASFVARAQSILDPGSAAGDRGSGRLDLWHAAIQGWEQHPWIGLGASNFQAHALDLLQTTPGVNTRANYVREGREVHNAYLEQLVGLGVVGLTLWGLVVVLAGWYFVASFRRARAQGEMLLERVSLALLVSLLGFALSAIFLSNELSRALWILVGLALALDVMTRRGLGGAGAPAYHLGVPNAPIDDPERRRARQIDDVLAAEKRFDRRREALIERERELDSQAQELEPRLAEAERRIERAEAEMAERRRALEAEEQEARTRLAAAESSLREMQEKVRVAETRASRLQAEVQEREQLAAEQARLETELANRARELAALEAEATAEEERRKAEFEERASSQDRALTEERAAIEAKNRELVERENAELKQRADADRRAVEEERRALEAQRTGLEQERRELAAREADANAEAERRKAELQERESTLDRKLEQERAALAAQSGEHLEREKAELSKRAAAEAKGFEEQRKALEKERKALEKERETMIAQSRELVEREKSELKQRADVDMQALEKAWQSLAKQREALEAQSRDSVDRAKTELHMRAATDRKELEEARKALERTQRALDKERSALEAQSRDLIEREKARLQQQASFDRQALEEERRALEKEREELAAGGEQRLQERQQQLDEEHGRAEAELADRERQVAAREEALDARKHELELLAYREQRAESAAEEASVSASPEGAARAPGFGPKLDINLLEHLVVTHGEHFPDRVEEWTFYLVYLRDFADVDGIISDAYTGLVLDVFGDVIAHDRGR